MSRARRGLAVLVLRAADADVGKGAAVLEPLEFGFGGWVEHLRVPHDDVDEFLFELFEVGLVGRLVSVVFAIVGAPLVPGESMHAEEHFGESRGAGGRH